MITANKGEWSELYALFKLLCDGELSAGDENLNKINNLIYPVIRILRQEHHHLFTYLPHKSEGIVEILRGEDVFQIPLQELRDITQFCWQNYRKSKRHHLLFQMWKTLYPDTNQIRLKQNLVRKVILES